jgi:GTPase
VLFLIDARCGITPLDIQFARWVNQQNRPALLLANKSEGRVSALDAGDVHRMGIGQPIYVSAAHNEGIGDVLSHITPLIALTPAAPPARDEDKATAAAAAAAELEGRAPRIAIMGRPNVGKSTLINRLLLPPPTDDGADQAQRAQATPPPRLLVGPEPGVTRDPVLVPLMYRGRDLVLIDTAGLRRRSALSARRSAGPP